MTEPRSPHFAKVDDRFDTMAIDIYVGTRSEAAPGGVVMATTGGPAMLAKDGEVTPSLSIPEEQARALYEALGRHFGGHVVDARTLRADYQAERARVDKLVDSLIGTNARLTASAVA